MRLTHLLVLFFLLLLAITLTYPLVGQIGTHVSGSETWAFDEYTFLWSMWYFKHALLDLNASPLHTGLIFFPLGLDLILFTYNLLAAIVALPLQLAMGSSDSLNSGVPLASNLANLGATVLSGYGAFLLARYLLRQGISGQEYPDPARLRDWNWARDGSSLLAALVFAFSANRAIYLALGHYNIFHTQWVPFVALYLIRLIDRRQSHDAALAGIFTGLALLTDMLYGVLLGLMALVIVPLWWLEQRRMVTVERGNQPAASQKHRRIPLLRLLLLVGIIAMLVSAPLLVPTVREGLSGDYALEGWGDAEKLSADLMGLVTPTALHPVFGADRSSDPTQAGQGWQAELRAVETGSSQFRDVNTVFLGYVTLLLALLGVLVGRRRVLAWLVLAGSATVLALGPVLQIFGVSQFDLDGLSVNVPLPFIVTHYLPFIQGYRAPNRFSIPLMLALAILAAYGTYWLLAWLLGLLRFARRRVLFTEGYGSGGRRLMGVVLVVVLGALVLFEHLAWPIPVTDARVPEVYRSLAELADEETLLQLPMGWRNGFRVFGSEDTRVQWYQSAHQRPIISGNAVRNPPFKFEYFERQPLLQALAGIEMYQAPDEATDLKARATVDDLLALWNVGYLVVNPPVSGRYPYVDTWQAARDYALDVLPVDPTPLFEDAGVQVYRIRPSLVPFPFSLDFGVEDTSAYRGDGWSLDERDIAGVPAIWALDQEADLYLPLRLDQGRPLQLIMRVRPFDYPGAPAQAISIEFNGIDLGARALPPGWQEVVLPVPREAVQDGLNRVHLGFVSSARPVDVLEDQGLIGNTGVRSPVDVEINSGGSASDIAYITVFYPDGVSEDASAGRRGYNLTAVDPRSGRILDVQGFDTWANEFEAARLADFLEDLPEGTLVLGATRDDASRFLTDRAVLALGSVGSGVDLRETPGYGHALFGVKGAAPGTAAEATSPEGAFLRVGSDRRSLSAALDWLRLEEGP